MGVSCPLLPSLLLLSLLLCPSLHFPSLPIFTVPLLLLLGFHPLCLYCASCLSVQISTLWLCAVAHLESGRLTVPGCPGGSCVSFRSQTSDAFMEAYSSAGIFYWLLGL